MIRSVRNPIVNVCRAASAHQRFWAGIRVVRESTTPASSRIDQSPRQPNAQPDGERGVARRPHHREHRLPPQEAVAAEVDRGREGSQGEPGVAQAVGEAVGRAGNPGEQVSEDAERLENERRLGRAAAGRADAEKERHDPVAEPVDEREQKPVQRREIERLVERGRQHRVDVAGEPDALGRDQQDRGEEVEGGGPDEPEQRILPVVLAFAHLAEQGEEEPDEEKPRGELHRAGEKRQQPPDRVQAERLSGVAQEHAREHQPETDPHRSAGARAADPEDARQGVVRDAHEKQRRKAEDLRVAVDLPVIEGHVGARGDAQQVDHAGRGAEGQRQEERSGDEVRREGARARGGRLGRGRGGGVAEGGLPDVPEEVVERETVHGGEPRERLVGPFVAAAVAQAVLLEHGARGRKAPRELADRHRRRHEAVRFRRGVRGLQVADDLREVLALGGAGILERVHSAAAGVEAMGGERRGKLRVAGEDVLDGEIRVEAAGVTHGPENGAKRPFGP